MDALRILSRSTTLSAKSKKGSAPLQTPSGLSKPNPQLFGQDAPAADEPAKGAPSRKRKRGQDYTNGAETIPEELNFFGDSAGTHQASSKTTKKKSTPPATTAEKAARKAEPVEVVPALPYTECKQLLRKHKIKIAQLWSQPPADSSSNGVEQKKKKKKKRKEEETVEAEPQKKRKSEVVVEPLTSFSQLRSKYSIPSTLAENLQDQGYSIPTEIQLGALPLLLGSPLLSEQDHDDTTDTPTKEQTRTNVNVDLLSVAPTGSGKTLAFLIPILAGILEQRRVARTNGEEEAYKGPKAIIVAPTKELASQITNEGRKLARRTGVKVTLVRKGMNVAQSSVESEDNKITTASDDEGSEDEDEEDSAEEEDDDDIPQKPIKNNTPPVKSDILVSTPLTLLHAITSTSNTPPTLPSIRYLVLDEADVLLDPLFREQTLQIWSSCTSSHLRVSLWSATIGASIEDLATTTLTTHWSNVIQPLHPHARRPALLRLIVGLKDTSLPTIDHRLIYCGTEAGKLIALRNLIHPTHTSASTTSSTSSQPPLRPPFLIFTQTTTRATSLHHELAYDIPATSGGSSRLGLLHASLPASQREETLRRFRLGEIWILITTDLLARGVDFRGLNGVVNYDVPASAAVYVHRVGRTGRAGRKGGVAVTLYSKVDVEGGGLRGVVGVVVASERGADQHMSEEGGTEKHKRLLDLLPSATKQQKKELKQSNGVKSRNVIAGKGSAKVRISTVSGYEKRKEDRRKGMVEGSRRRKKQEGREKKGERGGEEGDGEMREAEFGGFDD